MRKCLFLLLFLFSIRPGLISQYWQQRVNFSIDVSLDDKNNSLDGFETMEYFNNSPDTLQFIWIHLWPNAYKNDQTAFSDQLLENGNTSFYFSNKEQKGFINRLDFKVNNITARLEDHPQYLDIVKLILPEPLTPGESILITTPFHIKLPYNYSRGGFDGQSYQATQWFPKPAVYDSRGWHPMPYLDQGEFYSEFGKFDVHITVPKNYVVAATGSLQDSEEIAWLKIRSSYDCEPIKTRKKIKGGGVKTTIQLYPESSPLGKTLHFVQDSVHDFAWFADKRFIVDHDTCLLASGRIIDVFAYYAPAFKEQWKQTIQFSKDAIQHYSRLVGEYPYSLVSVVQGPQSFGGGMEYPTITIISPDSDIKSLDNTIAHEIGHNWFYGILATNEREFPWMDEGINTYYDNKYSRIKYNWTPKEDRLYFETKALNHTDQAINTTSEKFTSANYDLEAYYKTGAWMRLLESMLGPVKFNKAMQDYFNEWKFRHPQPGDFKNVLERSTGQSLDSQFAYLDKKGLLPNQERKGTKTGFIFPANQTLANFSDPPKNLITIGPVLGFNSYDKLMIGAFVTNIKLPPSPFQFFAAPMYATGSGRFTGLGFAYYTFYPSGFFRKIELGILGSGFTSDLFTDEDGNKNYLGFRKFVPGIKLTQREKNPRSTMNRYVQFKTFFINEEALQFYRDTVITGIDTTILNKYRTLDDDRSLLQLQLVMENNRALYPYRGELNIEKGKDFYRAAFTGDYFFNYPKGGGLEFRLFAGKFFYSGSRTVAKEFSTDRYHLNMTGPNGNEDYTYSDYFLGRNKFEGLASQQIMIRDGYFKVRTDLLAEKIGKTDNWLVAANFTTSIPNSINPLSLLPIKIPLKAFLDIGTSAGAWEQGAQTDRFLFDAGLEIPLFMETLHIYIPLFYSSVYKDYIKSTIDKKGRFFKTISFSFDLSNPRIRKFLRDL